MSTTAELVFVPTPGMGHLLSAVALAKLIIQRNQNISISVQIINLQIPSPQIDAYVNSQSLNNPYPTRLTFVTFQPLPNPPDPSSPDFFTSVIDLHKPLIKKSVEDRTGPEFSRLIGFVVDMFCLTMVDVANEFNVPSYVFFTSGAGFLNMMYLAQSMADDYGIDVPTKFSEPDFSTIVPGFKKPITSEIIPAVFQQKELGTDLLISIVRRFKETKGILINTYEELESYSLQALMDKRAKSTPTVYPVGPILELDNKSRVTGSVDVGKDDSIQKWLDGQPKSSVVFLCFGSMGSFDEEQIKEIATGLENSGHSFVWALRKSPLAAAHEDETYAEALPEGFLDRTSSKGKIIGWAPQAEILSHPAIGGFVSHCGWNSTLESLWFGVPMATFPLHAEQQLNAFTLVEELELAVEIRMDYKKDWKASKGNFLVTAHEIENGITKVMNMDEEMRIRVKNMSMISKNVNKDGGSSYNSLALFIQQVFNNVA